MVPCCSKTWALWKSSDPPDFDCTERRLSHTGETEWEHFPGLAESGQSRDQDIPL